MSISRRDFLAATGAAAVAGGLGPLAAFGQNKPILLGSVLDNSGNLDIYGKPMVMATTMAVEELNAAGGLAGRQIKAIQYDTQSDIALYTKFAQQLARTDKVDVVHGGITSASREAIRQTFRRANVLYFYNVLYEGGVCDRNCVVTGTTPAQAVEPIVEYAMKKWGKKVYILAADYNYGQITAKWLQHYVGQRGGSVASTDFFPLDVADFGSTIAKIQQANPDWVVSALVGGAHMSFYRQWAAQGMNKKIPLASTTFGVGNEHLALSPGGRRRHHHRRQLQPGGRYARQQGVPGALEETLRRHQDRARDRGIAVPGHLHVGGVREEGRVAGRQGGACCNPVGSLHRRAGRHGDHRAEDATRRAGHPPDGGEEPEAHHPQHRQAAPALRYAAVLRSDQEPERE